MIMATINFKSKFILSWEDKKYRAITIHPYPKMRQSRSILDYICLVKLVSTSMIKQTVFSCSLSVHLQLKAPTMAETTQKPHAIFVPYPLQGHVIPSVHLAIKLASKGFTITFINTPSTTRPPRLNLMR